jgi:hypothetical protein
VSKADREWYRSQPAPPNPGSRLAFLGSHYFQGKRYLVELTRDGAIVYLAGGKLLGWDWYEQVAGTVAEIVQTMGGKVMASKWIKKAVAKRTKKSPSAMTIDPALGEGRPALTEFMTELESEPGELREVSPLMITVSEGGIRAGLKDEDAGGWCWREGATLSLALDAIEKALQAGEGAFRAPRAKPGRKK